jgi:hypothetical protein
MQNMHHTTQHNESPGATQPKQCTLHPATTDPLGYLPVSSQRLALKSSTPMHKACCIALCYWQLNQDKIRCVPQPMREPSRNKMQLTNKAPTHDELS